MSFLETDMVCFTLIHCILLSPRFYFSYTDGKARNVGSVFKNIFILFILKSELRKKKEGRRENNQEKTPITGTQMVTIAGAEPGRFVFLFVLFYCRFLLTKCFACLKNVCTGNSII